MLSGVCCGCCNNGMRCGAALDPVDVADNVLAPEIEAALYAEMRKIGAIKYDDEGIRQIAGIIAEVLARPEENT